MSAFNILSLAAQAPAKKTSKTDTVGISRGIVEQVAKAGMSQAQIAVRSTVEGFDAHEGGIRVTVEGLDPVVLTKLEGSNSCFYSQQDDEQGFVALVNHLGTALGNKKAVRLAATFELI